ncbi:MAG TPA: Ig-like domain-containing protein, partial [Terriglobales bacterium]|nr:Ig-like domain-containing protein [Terriglobales bacterium]
MLFSVTMPTTPRHPSYNPITRRSVFLLLIAFVFVAARADAQANTALQFDGSTGYVGFGNPAKLQLSSFTIETWFMRTGTGTVSDTGAGGITNVLPLVTKGRGETDGSAVDMNYFLGIDTGRNNVLAADFEEGATGSSPGLNHPVRGTTPIQNNIWYHGAATYDGTTWRLYLNGNLEATLVVGKPPRSDSIQPAAIASGLNSTGTPAGYFSGVIDEARIWDRALSAAEIQQNINSELTSGSGLVARWGFNEGVGTAVDDSTAQPATGTLRGAASVWVSGAPFNIRINHPPDAPVLAAPADGASNIGTSATLDVTASDPDGDDLSVTFYGRSLSGTPGPDFMIAVLPDSQYYTAALNGGTPAMFDSQTQWIINNAASKNIVYVAHEGDITDSNISTQWDNANTAMSTLEVSPGVGFGLTLGNHDENGGTALFNQYFGASRFTGRPYYGGHYGTNNNNHYDLFGASGQEFIVVYLEYNASLNTAVMSWANNLLQTYRNRKAIIVNHDLLTSAVTPAPFSSEGQKIYDTLKANPNLFLMLCGHAWGEGRRSDAYNGNTVNTLIADYQDRTNGGSGWMRLLQFSPANNTIHVTTYSPWLNQSESDADSQFDLPYTPSFSMIGATTIAWNAHAAATWSGLYPGTAYEWYAAVNDGISTVTGPTWTFATANLGNRPPIAVNDEAATIEGTPVVIYVVSNDSDPDADAMTVASVTNAAHGAVLVNADNTVTYASEPGFAGTDTFTYTVKDPGNAESNAATVTITVRAINRPPSANAQAVTTDEGAAKAITLTGSDPDGDPLTYAVVTNPAHGTLSGTAPNLTYTPALNYSGADSFTFKVNDGTVDSAPATVTITVRAVNRAPVANAQAVTTNED